ncbi:anti sigma factor C-terminal domain-containing protein [Clostridium tetani]|nr:anti sigma factor C-terminal domain-containing protein [Clostridium tetani]BDR66499.1 hypothetical protein K144312032_07270 [Clostridium tetani]
MKNENLDDIFDSDKLMKDIKKGKRRSLLRIIIVSVILIITMFAANIFISNKIGDISMKKRNKLVRLSVPNGYISRSTESIGVLGGTANYRISRYIGDRAIILDEETSIYGLPLKGLMVRMNGGDLDKSIANKYPEMVWTWSDLNRWKNGYRKMKFYHPDLQYKQYTNDLNILDDLSNAKLIEVAVSFDKKYKIKDIENIIPNVKKSWYCFDAFTKEEIENYKNEIKEGKSSYIGEGQMIGINAVNHEIPDLGISKETSSDTLIDTLLNFMESSGNKRYNAIYKELIKKGYKDSSSIPVIGVIVYGTKDELKKLVENPHIKAASIGVITDRY